MTERYRFQAFISYSHTDEEIAACLHRALERFVLPRGVAAPPVDGAKARRIGAVFRDSDELAASKDLGEDIKEALRASRSLIVLCSPAAARSEWVAKEIAYFRDELGRDSVFAALVGGEPGASEGGVFPALLTENGREPFAPDLRGAKPSARRDAVIRLAAGVCNLDYDDLRRRELARARAEALRNGILAVGAGALALVAVGASVSALQANARLTTALAAESEARQQAQTALLNERRAREAERVAAQSASTLEYAGGSLFEGLNETAIGFAQSLITARDPGAAAARVVVVQGPSEEADVTERAGTLPGHWLRCPRNLADCFSAPQYTASRRGMGVIGASSGGADIDPSAREAFRRICRSFVGEAGDPILALCAGRPARFRDFDEVDQPAPSLSMYFAADVDRGFALFAYESIAYCGSGGCSLPWDIWIRRADNRFHRVDTTLLGADQVAIVSGEGGTDLIAVGISQLGAHMQFAHVNRYRLNANALTLSPLADFSFVEQYGVFGLLEGEYEVPPLLTVCLERNENDIDSDPCGGG